MTDEPKQQFLFEQHGPHQQNGDDRHARKRGPAQAPAEIRARFYGNCQNSRDPDTTDTFFLDVEAPPPGEFYGYLVIGVDESGELGLAGPDTDGRQRDFRAKDCL